MFKKIWKYIVGFILGIGSVLLIIARGNRQTTYSSKGNSHLNNTRIRQSNAELRAINKRENERLRQEKERLRLERIALDDEISRAEADGNIIDSTRRTVSDIIRNAKKDTD